MKKFIYIAFLLTSLLSFAQTIIPTGFDLQDPQPIDKKFLHNGATGRAAILNQFTGLFSVDVSDATSPKLMVKGSGGWLAVGNTATYVKQEFTFPGTAGTLILNTPSANISGEVTVTLQGYVLKSSEYTISGSQVVLNSSLLNTALSYDATVQYLVNNTNTTGGAFTVVPDVYYYDYITQITYPAPKGFFVIRYDTTFSTAPKKQMYFNDGTAGSRTELLAFPIDTLTNLQN